MMADSADRIAQEDCIGRIRIELLRWGKRSGRDFPWRHTRDPYKILVAEVMLHRTQASQVSPVYERFIEEFPDMPSLLTAEPSRIETILRPLGLRWRTYLLLKMIQDIEVACDGKIPLDRDALMALSGVGDYIASALLTFTETSPEPVMDTNTVRVIGRVFGLKLNDSARRNKRYREIMRRIVDREAARDVSFSMIDLAASICLPRKPLCGQCPLNRYCTYAQREMIGANLPQEL